jgi:hypothetical protein
MAITHPMSEPWLDWKPFDGLMQTNEEFVLVLMPDRDPSGRIQGCRVKDRKPFVLGGLFAWDLEKPTHWASYPSVPDAEQPETERK